MTVGVPARASASSSPSCSWFNKPIEAARATARVYALPRFRAPHSDIFGGGGGDGKGASLDGARVLIVEDDFIVAFDVQTLIEEHGATVIGPAADLVEARAVVAGQRGSIQAAILDVNLNGEHVFPLALELRAAGVPIVFATAYADDERLFPEALKDVPRLAKPVLPNTLLGQLRRLLGR